MNQKTLIGLTLGLATIVAFVVAFWPSPIPVSVATVQRGVFTETVEDEGYARVRQPYPILAPISGFLRRVSLEPGDQVSIGDPLFELESLPTPGLDSRTREQMMDAIQAATARVELAKAQLEIQTSRYQMAESEWERQSALYEKQFISKDAFERATTEKEAAFGAMHAAEHALEASAFELKGAQANLDIADGQRATDEQPTLIVRSPIEGTVINRERCCEGPIAMGEVVLEIGDLSTLEVRIDLLSTEAVKVAAGMPVVLEHWGGEGVLSGRVRRVEPRGFTQISALGVEEQRVPVLVEITSPPEQWQLLGDGYRVEGRFIVWQKDDVLFVPTSALFREEDQWHVFAVIDGRAHSVDVDIGRRSGLITEVVSGLAEGDRVITHPSDRITDQTRISVED